LLYGFKQQSTIAYTCRFFNFNNEQFMEAEIFTHNFSAGMTITLDKIDILGITIPTYGNTEDLIDIILIN
jgi:hypothetical protein